MPLYVYVCAAGHATELLRPRSVEEVACACGEAAPRQSVNRIGVTGFVRTPVDQREIRMKDFSEASAELSYESAKAEKEGRPAEGPNLWRQAKANVKQLAAAGVKDSLDL